MSAYVSIRQHTSCLPLRAAQLKDKSVQQKDKSVPSKASKTSTLNAVEGIVAKGEVCAREQRLDRLEVEALLKHLDGYAALHTSAYVSIRQHSIRQHTSA
jgi:hypothetical protein